MKNNYKTINKCQFSKRKDLKLILSLGFLPPVNDFSSIKQGLRAVQFFPTNLMYSPSSKLVQLSTIVDKKIIFPSTYPYTSSTTKILRENFNDLSIECKKIINFKKDDLIIDIGSNDGNLLGNFNNIRRLGVTPEDIGRLAIKKGIPTLLRYFNTDTSNYIKNKFGKAKIITATNVFAHIDDLHTLIKNILNLLKDDGIFISESHYLLSLIKGNQYDTIYHEHLRYYSLTSLKKIFEKYNLEIFHAKKILTHGGSIRVYVSKKKYKIRNSVNKIIKSESKNLNWKKFLQFRNKVIQSKFDLLKLLYSLKKKKMVIYGVGAPSRASTLINYTGLKKEIIELICEVKNSYKIGFFMPGTDIPVVDENIIFKKKPDYLLIFSWHIAPELIKNLKKKGYKGKFIVPLPKPKIFK